MTGAALGEDGQGQASARGINLICLPLQKPHNYLRSAYILKALSFRSRGAAEEEEEKKGEGGNGLRGGGRLSLPAPRRFAEQP